MKSRRLILVVSDPADAAGLPADAAVTADAYLGGEAELGVRDAVVLNLCRSYRYRTRGYYVSLLADARGQRVLPSVETIEGMAEPFRLFRALEEAGVPAVPVAEMRSRRRRAGDVAARGVPLVRDGTGAAGTLRPARADEIAELALCLGDCADPRFAEACGAIYAAWPAPLLQVQMLREEAAWKVFQVAPLSLHQLPDAERDRFLHLLGDRAGIVRRRALVRRPETRASIAVLVDPDDVFSPSTPETIDRFERVAAGMNVHARRIGLDELGRLGEYDALFIRALTGLREPAFQFALRAEALGMPVIDDPQSIIRCSNKVFLEELLRREGVPMPRTLVVTARTRWEQVRVLGEPFVIKLPDGSFSSAVHKIGSAQEYRERSTEMFRSSPLIIAQEFVPTAFDWRVTVLGGRALFTARYYMARGHWQIRSDAGGEEPYGRVEAVPREQAPEAVVSLALRAASLIGDGLYGVDIKETEAGPVVIEINDNPNLDLGEDDGADGDRIYEDLVRHFVRAVEQSSGNGAGRRSPDGEPRSASRPGSPARRHYRPFEVAGIELEYAVVDETLNPVSRVEPLLRSLAGRPTSDVELDGVGLSNEIAAHVLELKTLTPTASLARAEELLAGGVREVCRRLREEFGARLLPTGMHPWMEPRDARMWSRSGSAIYQAYARVFDTQTHGWMNVHAAHLNLPLGRENEAVALHNAAALLVPYLPALAASSPVFDGRLQPFECGRMAWVLEHQARLPASQGEIVPEYIESLADYRKNVLAPMYAALDAIPGSTRLRQEFLNARGAVIRLGRKALEIRVVDTQECVKLDIAIAVFARAALRQLTRRLLAGKLALPAHPLLVADLRATVRDASRARVLAPHVGADVPRGDDGTAEARDVLRALLESARSSVRRDEAEYLELVEQILAAGTLAERIRATLEPLQADPVGFDVRLRAVYGELADCLSANRPWPGRDP